VGDERHFRELERLRGAVGPALCADPAPCAVTTSSEVRIMPDGSEVRTGPEPRPLCEGCPERVNPRRPVLHVEVRLDYRNRFDGPEVATSAATLPSVGPAGTREGHGSPEPSNAPTPPSPEGDCLPPAWGPDHPARRAALGLEPPDRPRGRGDRETIRVDPRDFGLTP
jgi:hypothetical protein